ncbi:hypothetical protein ACNOYE_22490 [Nannocystaceae bacterium ST9]
MFAARISGLVSMPLVAALAVGCGGSEGTLALVATGEDAAVGGFPVVDEGETIAFADGWTLEFDKYLVSFGRLRLASASGEVGLDSDAVYVVDLHRGAAQVDLFAGVAAQRWDAFGFEVVAPPADAIVLDDVDEADVQRMRDNDYNYWIEGRASKDGVELSFAWGLANPTRNSDCTNGIDDTQGVVIRNSGTSNAEITFHLEHMFWNSLGTDAAELHFDPIAAMADADGRIEFDALADQNLADLRDADGNPLVDGEGNPIVYDPASVPLAADNLREFVLAAVSTQAHLDGGGLCTIDRI